MGDIADEHADLMAEGGWFKARGHVYRGCKVCGSHRVYWKETRGVHNRKRWALFNNDGSAHDCTPSRVADPNDEFTEIGDDR